MNKKEPVFMARGMRLPVAALVAFVASASVSASGQTYKVSSLAGTGSGSFGGDGGPASSASLYLPQGIAVDSEDNLYIADSSNHRIRKISKETITTVAGNGSPGYNGDGGQATSLQLSHPVGVAIDSEGSLYIADSSNHRVRKVSKGIMTTVAGNGTSGFSGEGGPATAAAVTPLSLAVDAAGNLFIADASRRVRKVANGVITTVAGSGSLDFSGDGGPANQAGLCPDRIWVDKTGILYISGCYRVRKVSGGTITTVAGNGSPCCGGDGGPATQASIDPSGLTVDTSGDVYLADLSGRIRKVSAGIISTIAGSLNRGFSGDGGDAAAAQFNFPEDVAADSAGNLYVADRENNRIRVLRPTPLVSGIAPLFGTLPIIQPGSWASIFGKGLARGTFAWSGDFPTTLGGTTVTVNGKPAYLSFVSPTQINFQAPDDAPTGTATAVLVSRDALVGTGSVILAIQSPTFSLLEDGKHAAGVILTPDGKGAYGTGTYDLLGPPNAFSFTTRAVKPGEILILYGVGFGPTVPQVQAGKAFTGAAPTYSPVNITIGGVQANVLFSGMTQAGLYQFNVTVPSTASGDQLLQATVNGVKTQTGVLVTVK